jgi:hypothetical protein
METRVCLPALGAEGTLLAGGSPYPARPARNNVHRIRYDYRFIDIMGLNFFLTINFL